MATLLLYHPCAVAAVITKLILGPRSASMLTDVTSLKMEVKQFCAATRIENPREFWNFLPRVPFHRFSIIHYESNNKILGFNFKRSILILWLFNYLISRLFLQIVNILVKQKFYFLSLINEIFNAFLMHIATWWNSLITCLNINFSFFIFFKHVHFSM